MWVSKSKSWMLVWIPIVAIACDAETAPASGEAPPADFRFDDAGTTQPDARPMDVGSAEPGSRDREDDSLGFDGCRTEERCGNGLDDDCDGEPDEDCGCAPGSTQLCYDGPAERAGRGVCVYGQQTCSGGAADEFGYWGPCSGSGEPLDVVCGEMMDWQCNGRLDEGCLCAPGDSVPCYTGPAATEDVGLCRGGTATCSTASDGTAGYGVCEGEVTPEPDRCDGEDRDCDGTPDSGCECRLGESRVCYSGPDGTAGVGLCAAGSQECVAGSGGIRATWGPCAGEVLPEAERCDGADYDCDGGRDTGCVCTPGEERPCYTGPDGTAGVGECREGRQSCARGPTGAPAWGACVGAQLPGVDLCDGRDRNCDGLSNVGCVCTPGDSRSCYGGPAGTAGVGLCRSGSQSCDALPGGGSDWTACSGEVRPAVDSCDGIDRDCDGRVNLGCVCAPGESRVCYSGPAGTQGVGICRAGNQTCMLIPSGGSAWSACSGEVLPGAELCDGVDRLCNGMPSVGCACMSGQTRPCYEGPPATRSVGRCADGYQSCVVAGGTSSWSSGCTGQVLPSAEICGNAIDESCDGSTTAGCEGTLQCPGDVTVPAGQPVTLTAMGTNIVSWSWSVVSGPVGGPATVVWSPSPPNTPSVSFRATIVGDYLIRVTAVDATGAVLTCEFHVVALPHGLRVELTWDVAGDLDLHLHNGNATPWFNSDDCHWSNRTPAWGAVLDRDDISGSGPENIRVDFPVLGMPYAIGVHKFTSSQPRVATIRVYCGDTSVTPVATFVSAPLTSTTGGSVSSCSNASDFWRVATVTFSDPATCAITPGGGYTTSADACTSL